MIIAVLFIVAKIWNQPVYQMNGLRCGIYLHAWVLICFSHVQLFVTPWNVACQAPLSMGFSRQEYWSRLPCPPPGDFPDPGIKPESLMSPALAGGFFTTSATWEYIKEWNFSIYNKHGGIWRALCWVKPVRQRQILYDITYMWNLKNYSKLVNITKKADSRCKENTSGHQGWGKGNIGLRE